MTALNKKWLSGLAAGALMAVSVGTLAAEQKTLHVYNWSDYIAPDTVANFEKETGIKVVYDVFDSNEVLEGKLMAGSTGFDLVVPSASFLERQLTAGVFQPLDKSKLPEWKNLDPELLKLVAKHDPDNKFAMPYMWATTGIGYNVDKVKAVLGENAPVDSWDLILKPENLEKLKSCGVSFLDAPEEVFATVLNYLGKDPNSTKADDYTGPATDLLLKLRPDVVAHISDHVFYANANKAATPLVSAEVRENPGIYPPADVRAKLFTLKVQDPKIDRVRTRAWTKVKSGK
ncbi:TPA: extracellular solute-binding protein [Escherichia coli]|nr:extracellular solute-binding protein [Escherichia coli]